MTEPLNQKGAVGLIAEYQCALSLHDALRRDGYTLRGDRCGLWTDLQEAIPRVGGELSDELQEHAVTQGVALASYLHECIAGNPQRLGLILSRDDVKRSAIDVATVGRSTNSGSSADLGVSFKLDGTNVHLPISLKAYRTTVSSLGSKGARASLGRVFLNQPKLDDDGLVAAFGHDARCFVALLADFKIASREFYASNDGAAFVEAYRIRKRDPLAKVNNPLRRKEVGDYFIATRGFRPEHKFAELYASMFATGMERLIEAGTTEEWVLFLEQMQFLIGMEADVLTLTASGPVGGDIQVLNSLDDGAYADIRRVLVRGCSVEIDGHADSSVLTVAVSYDAVTVRCLSLTIWKDATIQFKIDSSVRA